MERAVQQVADAREKYILACRFEQSGITGTTEGAVYQDLTIKSSEQFADLVVSKLRSKQHSVRRS